MRLDPIHRGQETDEQPEAVDPSASEIAEVESDSESVEDEFVDERTRRGATRRRFIGRSGKLLIYAPPLIQLFIPTKAMAASPSS